MNRAFLIVLVPPTLVAIGYVVVFRAMGMEPGYLRLAASLAVLVLGFWWIGRSARKKA
jgi:ABC-type spermidine/putrescine transport system permease subunit II